MLIAKKSNTFEDRDQFLWFIGPYTAIICFTSIISLKLVEWETHLSYLKQQLICNQNWLNLYRDPHIFMYCILLSLRLNGMDDETK